MKTFVLLGVFCLTFLVALGNAEDDDTVPPATDDQGSAEETAPPADKPDPVVTDDDVDPTIDDGSSDDSSVLSDPGSAEQDLPAELFKAQGKSVWRRPQKGHRSPYPPIVQGGRPTRQHPGPFKALRILKDHKKANGRYPRLKKIPACKNFRCDKVHQAGFYADEEFDCQVFRRCDLNGGLTSYLCPEQTIFNQITLVCDWYYNVKCSRSSDFYDYSNSRLYHVDWPLLGNGHRRHHDNDYGHGHGHGNGYGHGKPHNGNDYGHGHGKPHHDDYEDNNNNDDHHDGNGYGDDNDHHDNHHDNNGYGDNNNQHHKPGRPDHHHNGGHDNQYDGHEQDTKK